MKTQFTTGPWHVNLENALNVLAGIATGDLKTINRESPVIIKARAAIAKARGNL